MKLAIFQGPRRKEDVLGAVHAAAARSGAALMVCPEMVTTGYHIGERARELAEPADGPTAQRIAAIAADTGVGIAYGYPEIDDDTVYNSVQLIGPGGRLANYRKTHLFGSIDRSRFTAGQEPVVQADFGGFRIGMLICYDVEFPELVRAHAVAGTEILLVPTALMRPYERVADIVVPARAYENQLYVVYTNRCDTELELDYCGLSSIVAPTGETLARAGKDEELLTAEIDHETLRASRAENTHLADRRPELYQSITGGPTA